MGTVWALPSFMEAGASFICFGALSSSASGSALKEHSWQAPGFYGMLGLNQSKASTLPIILNSLGLSCFFSALNVLYRRLPWAGLGLGVLLMKKFPDLTKAPVSPKCPPPQRPAAHCLVWTGGGDLSGVVVAGQPRAGQWGGRPGGAARSAALRPLH